MLVFDINYDCVGQLYAAPGRLPPRILFQVMERSQAKRCGWHGRETTTIAQDPAVHLARVPLPAGAFITLGHISMPLLARYARKLAREHTIGSDMCAFVSPHYLPLRNALRPRITVYHPVDDYTRYWPRRARLTRRREALMIARANLVICTGHGLRAQLATRYPLYKNRMQHIPNPVPDEFIASPSEPIRPTAPPTHPIVGYMGDITGRVDVEAVIALATALPEALINMGSRRPDPDPFDSIPNIRYRDDLPRNELPTLIQTFDVCILPQQKSAFNDCASPRKLYEYLGSGRPVVALHSPEADTLAPCVRSTHTTREFVHAVADIVSHGEPSDFPKRRLALALDRTPMRLADRYADLLDTVSTEQAPTP